MNDGVSARRFRIAAGPVSPRLGWAFFFLAAAASAALLLQLQRDMTFVADEVAFIEWSGSEHWSTVFAPYNGNLSIGSWLGTRVLLDAFGTGYLPYSLFGIAGLWLSAGALYAYAKRRLGTVLGLAPAIAMLFLGTGWAILLQPLIGSVLVYSLGLGTCSLLALDRGDRRGDIAACVLLCASISFYSVGIAFGVGTAVAIALGPGWRGRAWVVLVPAGLYAAWRVAAHFIDPPFYLPEFGGELVNLLRAPLYFIDSLALVAGAVFAGGRDGLTSGPATGMVLYGFSWGRLAGALALLAIEVAIVAGAVAWLRRRGPVRPAVWAAAAMLVTLWVAQSYVLSPGRTAGESRYLFAGGFFSLILLIEIVPAVRRRLPVWAYGLAAAVLGVSVALNVQAMRDPRELLRDYSARARADMAMVELARDHVDPAFTPQFLGATVPPALFLTAGPWNEAVAEHGSPSFSVAELEGRSFEVKQEADVVLAAALGVYLLPAPGQARACLAPQTGRLKLPVGGATLVAPRGATVQIGRFAAPAWELAPLAPGTPYSLRIPRDGASAPWKLSTPVGSPIRICALG